MSGWYSTTVVLQYLSKIDFCKKKCQPWPDRNWHAEIATRRLQNFAQLRASTSIEGGLGRSGRIGIAGRPVASKAGNVLFERTQLPKQFKFPAKRNADFAISKMFDDFEQHQSKAN